jgi:hypothetical protein
MKGVVGWMFIAENCVFRFPGSYFVRRRQG